ncbi:MAG: metallophosphoesterase [Vicinamibacterales bacterium]
MTRRQALRAIVAGGAGIAAGGAGYGALYERRSIRLVEARVPVQGLPPDLSGLRVGLMTDVHHSRFFSREDVDRAVSLLMGSRPDLIALGGDYITWTDRGYADSSGEALAALSAPGGVYAVLGNHDDSSIMPRALSRRGVTVLDDARTLVEIRGSRLEIAGLNFWTKRLSAVSDVLRGASHPLVVIAHDPRRIQQASELGAAAVLAGHTHGGQIVPPIVGAVATRKYPVTAGLLRHGRTSLFVSRGLGTVYLPFRINCPPEVNLLTMVAA